jgi:ribosomal protein L11
MLEIKYIKKCFLMSYSAEPLPPLGTILGNIGVNTMKFCEEFNFFTKNLPNYFLLVVSIFIFDNKSFNFKINYPTTGYFLNLLKVEKIISIKLFNKIYNKTIFAISLKDLIQLALFKYPKYNIYKAIYIICGSIKSMNLIII